MPADDIRYTLPAPRASRLAPTPDNLARIEGQRAGDQMRVALVVEWNLYGCGANVRKAHEHQALAAWWDARFTAAHTAWMAEPPKMGGPLTCPAAYMVDEANACRRVRDEHWISALEHLLDALNGKGWV